MNLLVELPCIWMMHLDSLLVSLELKGLTRTATFTEAPDILMSYSVESRNQMQRFFFLFMISWSFLKRK